MSLREPAISEAFGTFFDDWLNGQQHLLEQLLSAAKSENARTREQQLDLIEQVMSHYKCYYEARSSAINGDVLIFFSPPWLTTFERTLTWLGEFKPSMIFNLVNDAVRDLTEEQRGRIKQVKAWTRREERELSEAMARIQESVASPSIFKLTRRFGRLVDGEVWEMDAAMEELKLAMVAVLQRADTLRRMTVEKVTEVLSPVQTIKFLAAAVQFQLRARKWEQQRDTKRVATGDVQH